MNQSRLRVIGLLSAGVLGWGLLSGCGPVVRGSWPPASFSAEKVAVKAPVQIYLDGLGVPHIFAQNDDDVAFAVGFLHGRDRRFQVELLRMASQGRLSELLGKSMLDTDRRLRLLSLNIEKVLAKASPGDLARLTAYCAGLNQAYTTQPLPLELKLLGYKAAPWTPQEVLLIGRFQAWDLSQDAELEGLRDLLATQVPSETLLWLITPSLHFGVPVMDNEQVRRYRPSLPIVPGPPPGFPLHDASGKPAHPTEKTAAPAASFEPESREAVMASAQAWVNAWLDNPVGGSNGWAISGKHTSNGRPILAGDPHLDLPWPPIFYEVHYHTPEVDVSGSTFPGMPMVVIGRTSHLAWTLTTSYADTQDLFAIRPTPNDPDSYQLDGKAEPFTRWPQTFRWGTKPDQSLTEDFLVTQFGPLYNKGREGRLRTDALYALSWPGFSDEELPMISAFDKLYRAQEPAEVQAAVALLPAPSQNWIYATASGHIGYVLGGKVPNRRASALPRDGSTRESAWMGMIPESERPMLVDPPGGYVVASNQPIFADVGRLNTYGSGGYRALRTQTALEAHSGWTAQEVRGLQVDTVNLEAARFIPVLKQAFESHYPSGVSPERLERVSLMASNLFKWDAVMRAEAPDALIYESWRQHVHRLLFGQYIKDNALLERYLTSRLSEAPLEVALLSSSGQSWWDDPSTPAIETRDDALVKALLAAEQELTQKLGNNVNGWTWGSLHTYTPTHPFAKKSILKPIFGHESHPMRGGRHTLIALNHDGVVGNYKVTSGSAMRQVVQFDGEQGYVLAGGNAGQPGHPNALNQLNDWMAGEQHVAGGDEATLKANAVGVITLKP